ncbi:MAG: formate--tetrahydrofolate ligase, partial [Actinobacteria bacterium]|nr:formate--tetrahydrofolate ligase [Actinomycetota bacterium]
MPTDIEIAQAASLRPLTEVAAALGLAPNELEPYGSSKAKIKASAIAARAQRPDGKLILVTAINPTPAGEGKTTTTIGLGQALQRLGHKAVTCTREPSLGPVFGVKGGAAGGGYAQVVPMEDINLHFTGDFAAVTSAHNLLAALLDNHLHQGNELAIDPRRVLWRRVIDMNDRALHSIVVGLGGRNRGVPRETGFDITPASEVMAILCLARDLVDLKARMAQIVVAERGRDGYVRADDLHAAGAMAILMKDAVLPNLVQNLENGPALIHGGPFGNIAHGCNSLIATRFALKVADYVVTEAGFGADLGAEKFFDIKCRVGGLTPSVAVLVATVRALKLHGGAAKAQAGQEDLAALERGLPNLEAHIENLAKFGVPVVVAVNRFPTDTDRELARIATAARALGAQAELSTVFTDGGAGGMALARQVLSAIAKGGASFRPLYDGAQSLTEKIETIAREIYGADGVDYEDDAARALRRLDNGVGRGLPICMAKTQYSLS